MAESDWHLRAVSGNYLLISDLAHEERQDTLNFIDLAPSHQQAFWFYKLLGVLSLSRGRLYVFAFHPLAAEILLDFLSFYGFYC